MQLFIRDLVLVLLTLAISGAAVPAHAAILVSSETVSTSTGGTGYVQILLKNDFATPQSLSGYSLEIALSGTGVRFIGVDDMTSPAYVFDGFGTGLLTFDLFPNTGFIASDISLNPNGFVNLVAGQTTGLARIAFEVDNAATVGFRPITFVSGPTTVFTDAFGNPFADSDVSFLSGGIDVQGSVGVVPEMSSIISFAILFGCALARRRRAIIQLSQLALDDVQRC